MVLASKAADLISRLAGEYVQNISPKQLKVDVLKGKITVRDAEIRPDAFSSLLQHPIHVVYGRVGLFSIDISWNNIADEPAVVHLENIHIIARQDRNVDVTIEEALAWKRRMINAFERKVSSRLRNVESNKRLDRLQRTILKQLELTVKDFHFRFEDVHQSASCSVSGVVCDQVTVKTTTGDADSNKKMRVENFAVYWNDNVKISSKKKHGGSPPISREAFELFAKSNASKRASQVNYVLEPTSFDIRLGLDAPSAGKSVINTNVVLQCSNKVVFNIHAVQYMAMLETKEGLEVRKQKLELAHLRPKSTVKESPKEWWKFAVASVLQKYSVRRTSGSMWEDMKLRREYLHLYQRWTGRAKWLQALRKKDIARMKEIEDSLDVNSIVQIRTTARTLLSIEKRKRERSGGINVDNSYSGDPQPKSGGDVTRSRGDGISDDVYETFGLKEDLSYVRSYSITANIDRMQMVLGAPKPLIVADVDTSTLGFEYLESAGVTTFSYSLQNMDVLDVAGNLPSKASTMSGGKKATFPRRWVRALDRISRGAQPLVSIDARNLKEGKGSIRVRVEELQVILSQHVIQSVRKFLEPSNFSSRRFISHLGVVSRSNVGMAMQILSSSTFIPAIDLDLRVNAPSVLILSPLSSTCWALSLGNVIVKSTRMDHDGHMYERLSTAKEDGSRSTGNAKCYFDLSGSHLCMCLLYDDQALAVCNGSEWDRTNVLNSKQLVRPMSAKATAVINCGFYIGKEGDPRLQLSGNVPPIVARLSARDVDAFKEIMQLFSFSDSPIPESLEARRNSGVLHSNQVRKIARNAEVFLDKIWSRDESDQYLVDLRFRVSRVVVSVHDTGANRDGIDIEQGPSVVSTPVSETRQSIDAPRREMRVKPDLSIEMVHTTVRYASKMRGRFLHTQTNIDVEHACAKVFDSQQPGQLQEIFSAGPRLVGGGGERGTSPSSNTGVGDSQSMTENDEGGRKMASLELVFGRTKSGSLLRTFSLVLARQHLNISEAMLDSLLPLLQPLHSSRNILNRRTSKDSKRLPTSWLGRNAAAIQKKIAEGSFKAESDGLTCVIFGANRTPAIDITVSPASLELTTSVGHWLSAMSVEDIQVVVVTGKRRKVVVGREAPFRPLSLGDQSGGDVGKRRLIDISVEVDRMLRASASEKQVYDIKLSMDKIYLNYSATDLDIIRSSSMGRIWEALSVKDPTLQQNLPSAEPRPDLMFDAAFFNEIAVSKINVIADHVILPTVVVERQSKTIRFVAQSGKEDLPYTELSNEQTPKQPINACGLVIDFGRISLHSKEYVTGAQDPQQPKIGDVEELTRQRDVSSQSADDESNMVSTAAVAAWSHASATLITKDEDSERVENVASQGGLSRIPLIEPHDVEFTLKTNRSQVELTIDAASVDLHASAAAMEQADEIWSQAHLQNRQPWYASDISPSEDSSSDSNVIPTSSSLSPIQGNLTEVLVKLCIVELNASLGVENTSMPGDGSARVSMKATNFNFERKLLTTEVLTRVQTASVTFDGMGHKIDNGILSLRLLTLPTPSILTTRERSAAQDDDSVQGSKFSLSVSDDASLVMEPAYLFAFLRSASKCAELLSSRSRRKPFTNRRASHRHKRNRHALTTATKDVRFTAPCLKFWLPEVPQPLHQSSGAAYGILIEMSVSCHAVGNEATGPLFPVEDDCNIRFVRFDISKGTMTDGFECKHKICDPFDVLLGGVSIEQGAKGKFPEEHGNDHVLIFPDTVLLRFSLRDIKLLDRCVARLHLSDRGWRRSAALSTEERSNDGELLRRGSQPASSKGDEKARGGLVVFIPHVSVLAIDDLDSPLRALPVARFHLTDGRFGTSVGGELAATLQASADIFDVRRATFQTFVEPVLLQIDSQINIDSQGVTVATASRGKSAKPKVNGEGDSGGILRRLITVSASPVEATLSREQIRNLVSIAKSMAELRHTSAPLVKNSLAASVYDVAKGSDLEAGNMRTVIANQSGIRVSCTHGVNEYILESGKETVVTWGGLITPIERTFVASRKSDILTFKFVGGDENVEISMHERRSFVRTIIIERRVYDLLVSIEQISKIESRILFRSVLKIRNDSGIDLQLGLEPQERDNDVAPLQQEMKNGTTLYVPVILGRGAILRVGPVTDRAGMRPKNLCKPVPLSPDEAEFRVDGDVSSGMNHTCSVLVSCETSDASGGKDRAVLVIDYVSFTEYGQSMTSKQSTVDITIRAFCRLSNLLPHPVRVQLGLGKGLDQSHTICLGKGDDSCLNFLSDFGPHVVDVVTSGHPRGEDVDAACHEVLNAITVRIGVGDENCELSRATATGLFCDVSNRRQLLTRFAGLSTMPVRELLVTLNFSSLRVCGIGVSTWIVNRTSTNLLVCKAQDQGQSKHGVPLPPRIVDASIAKTGFKGQMSIISDVAIKEGDAHVQSNSGDKEYQDDASGHGERMCLSADGGLTWSQPFLVDSVGLTGIVKCPYSTSDKKGTMCLAVSTSAGTAKFASVRVVEVRYGIYLRNETHFSIECGQAISERTGLSAGHVTTVASKTMCALEVIASRPDVHIAVRPSGGEYLWSGLIDARRIGSEKIFVVSTGKERAKRLVITVEPLAKRGDAVVLKITQFVPSIRQGGADGVMSSESSKSQDHDFRLRNETDQTLCIHQKGCTTKASLGGGDEQPIFWDEPLMPKVIEIHEEHGPSIGAVDVNDLRSKLKATLQSNASKAVLISMEAVGASRLCVVKYAPQEHRWGTMGSFISMVSLRGKQMSETTLVGGMPLGSSTPKSSTPRKGILGLVSPSSSKKRKATVRKEQKERLRKMSVATDTSDARKDRWVQLHLTFECSSLGLSLVDQGMPREILYGRVSRIAASMTVVNDSEGEQQSGSTFSLGALQIDNQCMDATFPVPVSSSSPRDKVFLQASIVGRPSARSSLVASQRVVHFQYISVLVQEFDFKLDNSFITNVLGPLEQSFSFEDGDGSKRGRKSNVDNSSEAESGNEEVIVYIERLVLHSMKIKASISLGQGTLNRQDDLASALRGVLDERHQKQSETKLLQARLRLALPTALHDAPLHFNSLQMTHVLETRPKLLSRFLRYYVSQGIFEYHRLLGSLDMLGNPVGLVSSLGAGVTDLFVEPAQALMEGPEEFIYGIGRGLSSLVSNTLYGVSNSASLLTGSLSNFLSGLVPASADGSIGGKIGKLAFAPAVGVLGVVSDTAGGIRDFAKPRTMNDRRMRYPRYISRNDVRIPAYDPKISMVMFFVGLYTSNAATPGGDVPFHACHKNVLLIATRDMALTVNIDDEECLWKIRLARIKQLKIGSKNSVVFVLDSPQKVDGSVFSKAVSQVTFAARDASMQQDVVAGVERFSHEDDP